MKQLAAAMGVVLGLGAASPSLAAFDGPVRVETGRLSGGTTADPAVTAFLGVPYGASTAGARRWRPPAPAKSWRGVRPADQLGPICPQPKGQGNASRTIGEDCLNLDIWTAASASKERRPVMVWFHGGEDGFGAGANNRDAGVGLAKKGVVVVTVNYRGGPFAQLATAALSRESGHRASGDYGLMDDIAALKWVKRNIAALGGDPGNVTIFGQSFGAGTLTYLAASPLARGLFHKIIAESHVRETHDPEPHTSGSRSLGEAEADGARFVNDLGVKSLGEMRALPWEKVIETYSAEESARGEAGVFMSFIRDGYVVPRSMTAVLAQGRQAHVPVMAGDNADETGAAPATAYDIILAGKGRRVNFPAPHTVADYQAAARKKFGPMADELLRLYPASNDREAFMSAITAARDNNRMSTWLWATEWRARQSRPVYLYYWTHAPPGPNHDITGAAHGSEIAYVYDRPGAAWTDEDRRIADLMSSYWANFARARDPNGPDLPRWAAFDGKTEQAMELGDHFQPVPLPDRAKADFWRRFYASQPAR